MYSGASSRTVCGRKPRRTEQLPRSSSPTRSPRGRPDPRIICGSGECAPAGRSNSPRERLWLHARITPLDTFVWTPQPEAARFVDEIIAAFYAACPPAARLAERMLDETGTRLADWIDHLGLADTPANVRGLQELGFEQIDADSHCVWHHPGALFPTIHFDRQADSGLGIKVESVADFLAAQGLRRHAIEGDRWLPCGRRGCSLRRRPSSGRRAARRNRARGRSHRSLKCAQGARTGRSISPPPPALRLAKRRDSSTPSNLIAAAVDGLGRESGLRSVFCRRARVLAAPQSGRPGAESAAGRARARLGQPRPPHLSLQPRAFHPVDRRFGATGLSMPRTILRRARCRLGRAGARAAGLRRRDLCRRRPDARRSQRATLPISRSPPREQLGTVGLWCRLHGEAFLAGRHAPPGMPIRFRSARRAAVECGSGVHEAVHRLSLSETGLHQGRLVAGRAAADRRGCWRRR